MGADARWSVVVKGCAAALLAVLVLSCLGSVAHAAMAMSDHAGNECWSLVCNREYGCGSSSRSPALTGSPLPVGVLPSVTCLLPVAALAGAAVLYAGQVAPVGPVRAVASRSPPLA